MFTPMLKIADLARKLRKERRERERLENLGISGPVPDTPPDDQAAAPAAEIAAAPKSFSSSAAAAAAAPSQPKRPGAGYQSAYRTTVLRRIGAKRRTGWKKVEIAGNPRAVLAAENAAIELYGLAEEGFVKRKKKQLLVEMKQGGEQSSGMMDYVDPLRALEAMGARDIKADMERVRKEGGQYLAARVEDLTEAEFADMGGINGFIERAKCLFRAKKFRPALLYVDLAIKYALRDLPPYMVDETSEILLARQLRSKCLLLENMYPEAELEAENCIRTMRRVMPSHIASALYVQAEALYLQCQFDRALVVYSQGMRTRVELYATAFKAGAKKSKTAIMQTLKPLHLVPEHLWQGLGRQGRAFRSFVDQIFRMEEEEEGEEDPFDIFSLPMAKGRNHKRKEDDPIFEMGDESPEGQADPNGVNCNMRPREITLADVAAIKVKATRHHNEIKRMNALKSKAKGRKASDTVAKKSRGWVTAGKLNNDVYLRRLMAEELFLGSLKNLFFNDQIVMAVQEQIEDFDSAATQETAMRFRGTMSDDKMRKMKKSSFMKSTQSSRASSVDTTPPNVTPNVVLAASKQRRALDREAAISDIITVNVDLNFQSELLN